MGHTNTSLPDSVREDALVEAGEDAIRLTRELIRRDSTNHGTGVGDERAAAEFAAEALGAAGLSPVVLESADRRANVVVRVPGTDPDADALLVHGHLDVVPADAHDWTFPPFAGEIADCPVTGAPSLWGRGAVDMKNTIGMVTAVVRYWSKLGLRPRRDIVLAFVADEEDSAAYGADYLVRGHADLFEGCTVAIGEGGGHTVHAESVGGDVRRLYPIGSAERGSAWLTLRSYGTAGHGSRPPRDNAVGALAAAVSRIDQHRWPLHLTPVTRAAIDAIAEALEVGRTSGDLDSNEAVDALVAKFGTAAPLVSATVRNSTAPTMLSAGYKVNVVPSEATAGVDGRVLPGAEEQFVETMDALTGDRVEWEYAHSSPPVAAPVDSAAFEALRAAVLAHDPEGLVVPVCLGGGTDAKVFARLGIDCYGFSPLRMPAGVDYPSLLHGVDERVPLEGLRFGVRVLDSFLRA
ncbi:M20/M25/M40 family metallo-hydrolase [Nocardiopsis metallicus]|uniref:Acetylornithine deacetylase/succinyl-diaminopimelate desuccinylase-like protein n=1 Tax=Nocardiopsis metallicus TaxID=179819 RepID=A0A840WNX4_9ACTN|nr:M20/M25/M40 family metallo-hydrolase [Nocardiopsis metallicus]MBB5491818.1 acetylornithine deacetylase/succinyl-diaminopimelate desuccinylase-like protein [Nocardiopsis metallicus]